MKRFTIGSSVVLALLVFGFMGQGGEIALVANGAVFLSIILFVFGSWVMAFGVIKPMQMVADAFRSPEEGLEGRLVSHVLVCECASRAALFGAAIAGLMGVLVVVEALGGDVSVVSYRLSAAMVAPVYGGILSAWIFAPLKHRFLSMERREFPQRPTRTWKGLSKDFLLVTAGIGVTVSLVVAYLFKFIPLLVEVLRQ